VNRKTDIAKAVAEANRKFIEKAAGSFMVIRVSVKRWDGIKRSAKVARYAEKSAGAESGVATGSVYLLGKHQSELKAVVAAGAKIGTYLDEWSLPSDIGGEYVFHVDQTPEAYSELLRLAEGQQDALEKFLPNYNRFIAQAKRDLGKLNDGLRYPDENEVRERFRITISPPRPLPVVDVERYRHLPVEQAAEWAAQAEAQNGRIMESAREYILSVTRDFMDDLAKSMEDETFRLTEKKAKRVEWLGTQLHNLVADWDNDPRLLALAELIEQKITPALAGGNVKRERVSVKEAAAQETRIAASRTEVTKAARNVVKGIDAHQKNVAKLRAKVNKSDAPAGTVVGGGILADLI